MVDPTPNTTENKMLYVSFNQDASCFAVSTDKGFQIFSANPFKETYRRNLEGGIGQIQMLNKSNILALVGGGRNPKFSLNKVIIWDDQQGCVISELRFGSNIKNVKLKSDKIFIVTESKIYLFNFISFESIDTIDTGKNENGMISISTDPDKTIVAYLAEKQGHVQIKVYNEDSEPEIKDIRAHSSNVACISLNKKGNLLATASDNGTLIRIFNVIDGTRVKQVRRGTENAIIYSISFDMNSKYIVVTSDRATVHLFSIEKNEEGTNKNQTSFISKVTKLFNKNSSTYFDSEWSFAKLKINETKCIASFVEENGFVVVTADGKYYRAKFDPAKGGECTKIDEQVIQVEK